MVLGTKFVSSASAAHFSQALKVSLLALAWVVFDTKYLISEAYFLDYFILVVVNVTFNIA